jgi:hypothetical protein
MGLNMGKTHGPTSHTCYINPKPKKAIKRGQDPAISPSPCARPSTSLSKSQNWSNMTQVLCNVPTLGHHHRAKIYDDQSSQMGARVSTGVFERHYGVHLTLMIIFHYYEPFRIGWLWFRCILAISMILTILSYKSMQFTEEVILGTLLGGTSQCNSSLESGGETL